MSYEQEYGHATRTPHGEWYSTKEIYEMLHDTREETRRENRETKQAVQEIQHKLDKITLHLRQHNGVKEDVEWCMKQIKREQYKEDWLGDIFNSFRLWGGWLVALAMLLLKLFGG